jgi:hypothetical protein
MKEVISWDNVGIPTRLAVVELCGWVTLKGKITLSGKKLARTSWDNLPSGARNVLTRHGIIK